jgi:hypothetical protein
LTRNTGKVAAVKKIVPYMLMLWLALMSVGASAHASLGAAHATWHTPGYTTQQTQHHAAAVPTVLATDTTHTDACNHSHCGHGHAAGMLAPHGTSVETDATTALPVSHENWASGPISSNIERPKWPVTTPVVVSL